MIPFGPFEPDKSRFNAAASEGTLNVLPSADGWKGMPSLTEISTALGDECLGYVKVQDSNDNLTIIAGTRTDLYKLNTSTSPYSWDNISKSAAAYSVPIGDRWQFAVFGDHIIACNLGTILQAYDINTPTAFADVSGSPTARSIWVTGDYLCVGSLLNDPSRMAWSGINDYTAWTYGEDGSDTQLFADGGEVLGGFGAQNGGIVMQRDKIRYQNFAPNTGLTFTFSEANSERGTLSQFAFVSLAPNRFFYLSSDGFFSGVDGIPIGAERVDEWFFNTVDHKYLYDVRAVPDPFEKIVWWLFRTINGTRRLLGYDWQLDRWCLSDQDISDAGPLLTPGVTWDGLDVLYSSIDEVNLAFDSRFFKGGSPAFAAFTTDNKLAYFVGTNQAATLQTAEIELNPGYRSMVNGGRVRTDATSFTATIASSHYHGGTLTVKTAVSPSTRSGLLPFRCSGRLHQVTVNIPAGTSWTSAAGIELTSPREGMQ
jgi:hypothetical protein